MHKNLDDLDDQSLRRALLAAAQAEYDAAQQAYSAVDLPSPMQPQEPRALPVTAQRKGRRHTRSLRVLQRVACVFLASALFLCVLGLASPSTLTNLFSGRLESEPTHDSYIHRGAPLPKSKLADWYPTYIPDDFAEIDRIDHHISTYIDFESSTTNELFHFSYHAMQQGNGLGVNNENVEISDVTVNGLSGRFYKSTDGGYSSNMLIWMDEANRYSFLLASHTLCDELIQIAESVEKVE